MNEESNKKSTATTRYLTWCKILMLLLAIGILVIGIFYLHISHRYFNDFQRIMKNRFDKDWTIKEAKTEYNKWFNHEDYNWLSIVDGKMVPMYEDRYPTATGVPEVFYSDIIEPGYYFKIDTFGSDKYYIIMTVSIPDQNHPTNHVVTFDLYKRYENGFSGWERGKYVENVVLMESKNDDEMFDATKAVSTDYSFIMSMDQDSPALRIQSIEDSSKARIISGTYVRILKFDDWENWDPTAWDGTKWIGGIEDEGNE